jgi:hypothetical protein
MDPHRGTSLIRNRPTLAPYSGFMPRTLLWPRVVVVCYERGTPVVSTEESGELVRPAFLEGKLSISVPTFGFWSQG